LSVYLSVWFNDEKTFTVAIPSKYQLSLTKPRDALHHGKGAADKGGRSLW